MNDLLSLPSWPSRNNTQKRSIVSQSSGITKDLLFKQQNLCKWPLEPFLSSFLA